MSVTNAWEAYFDGTASVCAVSELASQTVAEVDFVLAELNVPLGSCLLDVGCGGGGRTVALARRGYRLTGVDSSSGMLAEAEKAARAAGVPVTWIKADAAVYRPEPQAFDGAVCLGGNAFGLLGIGDDPLDRDLAILRNIYAGLKPGASFILTALNGMGAIRRASPAEVACGRFEPLAMTEVCNLEWETPGGKCAVRARRRSYVPTELTLLFRMAGFEVKHIGGVATGRGEKRPLGLDEMELMAIAQRSLWAIA